MTEPRPAIEVLLELTSTLKDVPSLDERLQRVTDAALELFPKGRHSSVRLLDKTGTLLRSAARSGEGRSSRPVVFRPSEGLVGWVVKHGEPALIGDCMADPRFVMKSGQGFHILSILAVPIRPANKVVGVLAITSPNTFAFETRDTWLANLLVNSALPFVLP